MNLLGLHDSYADLISRLNSLTNLSLNYLLNSSLQKAEVFPLP